MNFKNKFSIFILLILILSIGCVSASDMENNDNLTEYFDSVDLSQNSDDLQLNRSQNIQNQEEQLLGVNSQEDFLSEKSDEITVNNWDELQYYCSLKDKDYVLKLKENTNYYPTNPSDSNYQIKVYNNVKIIGGNGSYIGYSSSSAPAINYAAIVVPTDYKSSINLVNVDFKWISVSYGSDGVFLQIGGKRTSILQDCNFNYVTTNVGHSTIVHLKKGTATLDNCSFINCTTDYGCVSVYDSNNVKTVSMLVNNCYFENNYAKTEPGCINNCGSLTVCNTTFIKNRSFWWAGAIHTHNYGNTTIYDSHFIDNVAGWNGGALYTYSYLQVYNSEFIGNNCTTNSGGGAIGACSYQSDPHILIENCLFENNANNCWSLDDLSTTGTGAGGAIALMDKGSIIVLNTTFISNSASIGSAISAHDAGVYGSPEVIIINNSFINHTMVGDVLSIRVDGTTLLVSGNHYYHNDVEFSHLTLSLVSSNDDFATLKVDAEFLNPQDYDSDLLSRMSYDVYVDGEYLKTVDGDVFDVEFDDFDNADIYVIPTISIKKSNSVNIISTREYIFVSKSLGSDDNDGLSRLTPVNSIKKALEICDGSKEILILDGVYDESNLQIDYNLTIKGEGNVLLTNNTSFIVNSESFTLKKINVSDLMNDNFIKQVNGKLFIDKCVLNNNNCSRLIDADLVEITRSILINNNIVVFNNNHVLIKNSVLLNNSNLIGNNVVDVDLDYNWWGNSLGNLSKPSDYNIDYWMVLNANVGSQSLSYLQSTSIQFGMYLTDGNVLSKYNDFIKFNLNINVANGISNKDTVNNNGNIIFTQSTTENGNLKVNYNHVSFSIDFKFIKSDSYIVLSASNIKYGEDLIITFNAPKDIGGYLTVSVNGSSITQTIKDGITFPFKNLKAGVYNIVAFYSGNNKYVSKTVESKVTVNRYSSTTTLTHSVVEVGNDLVFTVATNSGASGNITFSVNDVVETLTLVNYKASYTIKNIKRGDYLIKAVYNGNEKYDVSEDSISIEVDNLVSDLNVSIENTSYGEAAVVNVVLNDDATGSITAYIGGISNSSEVVDGRSKVYLYGVDVGVNQQVSIFYTGDNTYFNKTADAFMNVSKSDLVFDMSVEDIHIGDDAVVFITVPAKTNGNFIINGHVVSIPMSGEVSYIIPDLEIGNYTVTGRFEGKNYFDVEKSVDFKVLEYSIPQWANDGENTQNNQKSSYVSQGGFIKWQYPVNETIIANIVIDSEGNVFLVTNDNVYSVDGEGNLNWIYQTDGRYGNFSGVAVGRDVVILPKVGDTLYFINQSSGEKYGESNIYLASSLYSPIINSNATIFTVSEYQFESSSYNLVITPYRLWANGGNPILVSLGNIKPIAAPTLNDDVIVVLGENTLMIFDANTLKSNSFLGGNFKEIRPVIGDGNIVYAIASDVMYAFSMDGSQLWYSPITGGSGDKLVLDCDKGVYATNADGNLYRYDLIDGVETLVSDLCITSGILIDDNSNLYFGCDNLFYAIDSEGNVLWKTDLSSKVTGTPVMNRDGVIYVTTSDNKLFALGNSTAKPVNNTNTSSESNHAPADASKPSNNVVVNKVSSTNKKITKKASKITAKKKTFKKSKKIKKYSIILKSGKNPIKKVKVTIKIGKKTYSTKTNAKGKATFKIKKLTKKGKYTAVIKFAGNKSFKPTTKKVKIVVK